MVRDQMKLFLYFLALILLCFGAKTSKADSGKSIEKKRKFVSISNKAENDAVIRCKSDDKIFNKTLRSGEKIRWGLPKTAAPTAICHVDLGGEGPRGYLSMFLEERCKRECKWRVFDGGVLKLKLAGGEWESFELVKDEEAAMNYDENDSCDDEDDDDEDDGARRGKGKQGSGESRSPAPAIEAAPPTPTPAIPAMQIKTAPPPSRESGRRKLKPRNPRSATLAPTSKNTKSAPPPMKHGKKSGLGNSPAPATEAAAPPAPATTKSRAPLPAMQIKTAPPPTKHDHRKLKPRNPRTSAPVKAPENVMTTESEAPAAKSAPPLTKHGRRKHRRGNFPKWKAPALADWMTRSAPPPPPMKHMPGVVKSPPPPAEGGDVSPPPMKQMPGFIESPAAENGEETSGAPPPMKQMLRDVKSPPPPPIEGGEESKEGDSELPPLPRPGTTFYTCIKEDPR